MGGLEDQFSTIRNKKFNFRRDLDRAEKLIIEVFIAAMHARTKKQLKHLSDQWKHPLKMMDQLAEQMKTATEEEKRNFAKMSPPSSNSKRDSLTHEQVRKIVEDPVSTLLLPLIRAEAPLLGNLDFSILCTDTSPGFITSDSPCVWFDPKSCTRPPLYQAPALMYETIEISLPVSPKICILLNRQGSTGYQDVPEIVVSEINRRTRFYASEYYVTSQNVTDSYWFDPGKAPDDSWDNRNKPSGCNSSRRLG